MITSNKQIKQGFPSEKIIVENPTQDNPVANQIKQNTTFCGQAGATKNRNRKGETQTNMSTHQQDVTTKHAIT
jgi:hypothetical protein